MKKIVVPFMIWLGVLLAPATLKAQTCGEVTIANMTWQSSELLAHVDQIILSSGYGCKAEVVAGDTVPSAVSMIEKGSPDIIPESWVNVIPDIIERGLAEKRVIVVSDSLPDGGINGLWIPQYFAEAHPEIRTFQDVLKNPQLFPHPEDPTKGAIITSPSGWGAVTIIEQLFKANGGEETGFVLVDPGSAAGLDGSLIRAYERRQAWIGYYWSPTSLLGKYPMVRVDLGAPYDEREWKRCITVAGCTDPQLTEWPAEKVLTLITPGFAERAGSALAYLEKRNWSNELVSKLLAYMSDNQATGEEGARYFLENHKDVWSHWVPADIAAKIEAALPR